jgi:hypothetical protein
VIVVIEEVNQQYWEVIHKIDQPDRQLQMHNTSRSSYLLHINQLQGTEHACIYGGLVMIEANAGCRTPMCSENTKQLHIHQFSFSLTSLWISVGRFRSTSGLGDSSEVMLP